MASRRATGGPGHPRQPLKYQRAALVATETMQRVGVIPAVARGRSPPRRDVDEEEQYDSQDDSRASTAHSDEHDAYATYSDRSAAGGMRPLSPRAAGMVPLPSSASLDDRRSATGTEASDAALDRDHAGSDVDDGLGAARSDRRHARGAERSEEASRQYVLLDRLERDTLLATLRAVVATLREQLDGAAAELREARAARQAAVLAERRDALEQRVALERQVDELRARLSREELASRAQADRAGSLASELERCSQDSEALRRELDSRQRAEGLAEQRSGELAKQLAEAQAAVEELGARNMELVRRGEELRAEAALAAQECESLRGELQRRAQEVEHLRGAAAALETERGQQREVAHELSRARDAAAARSASLSEQVEQLRRELATARAEVAAATEAAAAATAEAAAARAAAAAAEAETVAAAATAAAATATAATAAADAAQQLPGAGAAELADAPASATVQGSASHDPDTVAGDVHASVGPAVGPLAAGAGSSAPLRAEASSLSQPARALPRRPHRPHMGALSLLAAPPAAEPDAPGAESRETPPRPTGGDSLSPPEGRGTDVEAAGTEPAVPRAVAVAAAWGGPVGVKPGRAARLPSADAMALARANEAVEELRTQLGVAESMKDYLSHKWEESAEQARMLHATNSELRRELAAANRKRREAEAFREHVLTATAIQKHDKGITLVVKQEWQTIGAEAMRRATAVAD